MQIIPVLLHPESFKTIHSPVDEINLSTIFNLSSIVFVFKVNVSNFLLNETYVSLSTVCWAGGAVQSVDEGGRRPASSHDS